MRKKIAISLLGCMLILVISACRTQQFTDLSTSSNGAIMESKKETVTENLNKSPNDDYVGSWTGFGMIGNDEKLIPMPENMMGIVIKSNGYWSLTADGNKKLMYSGDWKIEKLSGNDTLVFYDSGVKVAYGSLNNDGTLGIIFYLADADTFLLFEKD